MALEYHEPPESLQPETRELHRGLASLIEELEAIDWYQHRIDTTDDEDLKQLLAHNQHEEMEHAAMALEWLRRRLPVLDRHLHTYLFREGPIAALERKAMAGSGCSKDASLGIGAGKESAPAGEKGVHHERNSPA